MTMSIQNIKPHTTLKYVRNQKEFVKTESVCQNQDNSNALSMSLNGLGVIGFSSLLKPGLIKNIKGFYLENGQEINKFLRTGKFKDVPVLSDNEPEWLKKVIEEQIIETKNFNRAIVESIEMIDAKMASKTEKPMTVYRDAPSSWLNTAKDGVITDKAFCSTSTEPGASAEGMITGNFEPYTRYEIRLPKNTPYWDLTNTSEKEMLLPRNSKFKVIEKNILELIL